MKMEDKEIEELLDEKLLSPTSDIAREYIIRKQEQFKMSYLAEHIQEISERFLYANPDISSFQKALNDEVTSKMVKYQQAFDECSNNFINNNKINPESKDIVIEHRTQFNLTENDTLIDSLKYKGIPVVSGYARFEKGRFVFTVMQTTIHKEDLFYRG